jgi:hypothetical protein
MRYVFLLVISLIAVQENFGQLNFGFKAGISSTQLKNESLGLLLPGGTERFKLAVKDANFGFNAGLVIRLTVLRKFIAQSEIVFNSSKVDFEINDFYAAQTLGAVLSERYTNIDLPLMAGLKFGPLRIMTGPQAHFIVNSISELTNKGGFEEKWKTVEWGWIGGVGLDIWKIMVDLRYETKFSKLGNHLIFNGQDVIFSEKPKRVMLALGFFF